MNVVILSAAIASLDADMYLHYFRGSNNRLNEQSANRNNGNRLFDSQNNNRGGYNCCDLDPEDGFDANDWIADFNEMYDWRFLYDDDTLTKQYEEVYFVESDVSLTWTNQHGTGNKKLLSQMILQFGCDTLPRSMQAGADSAQGGPEAAGLTAKQAEMRKHGLRMELWNGGNTNTPDDPDAITGNNGIADTYSDNNAANEGRHESEEWYYLCEQRARQYGLFHADQDLQGDAQIYTRQNPAGTRRGLECPEERDYYPWWNPSPWHDIAIITPSMERCANHIAPNSQNVAEKCSCINGGDGDDVEDWFPEDDYVEHNLNETNCEDNGGDWDCFSWGGSEPECVDSYWTKVNYLGNADGTTRGGKQAHYDWKLPSYQALTQDHFCYPYVGSNDNDYEVQQVENILGDADQDLSCVRMVFRIRYNMSTMDYDPFKTNSTHDYEPNEGILSPIEQNPEVDVGFYVQGLQLAINTAQTGRTFQDRSHTFLVCNRPNAAWQSKEIINVNVRGKRGNIVQTFPATEYDFEPQHVEVSPTGNQCFHFQWCGSNTHNNGAPGGDGQTGDDGEGRGGSDRSNLAQMADMDQSYPVPYDTMMADGEDVDDWFDYVDCYHPLQPTWSRDGTDANNGKPLSKADAQLVLGTAGFYKGVEYMEEFCEEVDDDANNENRGECIVDELLNNVSASFRAGLICCMKEDLDSNLEKTFAFLSTRNNNFSNRSQKWKFVISTNPDAKTLW